MVPTPFDYSKLTLTDEEQAIFDRFRKSDIAVLTRMEYHILRKKQLITVNMDGEDPWYNDDIQSGVCKLSPHGKGLRVYQNGIRRAEAKAEERYQQEQAKDAARDRRNYRIAVATLVVAIATLVVTIIALCHQLCS